MAYTVDQVVALDVATSDEITALSERHAAEMELLTKKRDACRSWLLNFLNTTGQDNAKTQHGTAYKSEVMSATIDKEKGGWDKLLAFVLDKAIRRAGDVLESHGGDDAEAMTAAIAAAAAAPELDLINRSVNKTAVKALMEDEHFDPQDIGVKIATVVNLNVRRA